MLLTCSLAWSAPVGSGAAGASVPCVPYLWRNVVIRGGGFVTGIIFHPRERNLIYARTDVGGAYRWDAAARRWIPLTDWIGPAEVNLTGIESLAVDPSDPNRVYLAAGTYTGGEAAILRSDDQGRTFQKTIVPFKMGGNEAGRFNGERLAVDPNDGKILFFGSREDGLWRSADRGATWSKVAGFPETKSGSSSADPPAPWFFRPQPVGIVSVVFDASSGSPGKPTPLIYAAVSTASTNFFRSADGGNSWQAVPNQPLGLCPNHLVRAPDGWLYLSYGKQPGPNTMTDGAIWKFDPATGAWTDITPVKPAGSNQPFGYGCVAVDAAHPATLLATTFCHWKPHDEIFRSRDRGARWTQLWRANTEWDHAGAPYTRARAPHWMGTIAINPFDPDQALFSTGYGIWSSVNLTAADSGRPTRWVFLDRGLEETVPLALISPPRGAHLLSGLGDIDGFRHDELDVSPPHTFAGPLYANTESLAFAGRKPAVLARTGTIRSRTNEVCAAYSLDGGKSWRAFATAPFGGAQAGFIAVSADGTAFVWTPRGGEPCVTKNQGTNWVRCAGLSRGVRVVADPENANRFYACDPRAGKIYTSTDGAADFAATATAFPAAGGYGGGFGGSGGAGARLYAAPGREGDLWLAFRSAGLYHSTNGGASFERIAAVQRAVSLGFGKAAPGRESPALYLVGTIGARQGVFRSDDAAKSWVRINDDAHQFGWVDHITGDPRVYGRVYFGTGGRGIICGDPRNR